MPITRWRIISAFLCALLICPVLALPKAAADRPTGTVILNDAKRGLLGHTIQPGRIDALATEAGRTALVSLVYRYCQGLEQVVPRNSPSEQEWLINEFQSGSSDRMSRATFSVEGARWRMALILEECFRWVDVYQEADRGSGRFVVGQTGALIELGRAFGGHLELAQAWVDLLAVDDLSVHALVTREIMDLSLVAASLSLQR